MDRSHPHPKALRALAEGVLADEENEEVARHLESCVACRDRFDDLMGATDILRGLTPRIGALKPPDEPFLVSVLAELKAGTTTGSLSFGAETTLIGLENASPQVFSVPPESPIGVGTFGPYAILERISTDELGDLFQGVDPLLNRPILIKVLSADLAASEQARDRFLRDARAMAAVVSDHVVAIHAIDDAEGRPYIVMQHVSGITLQEKIDRQGCLGREPTLSIGLQLARGLAALHEQGLVHGNLHPAGILLEQGSEHVKITDRGSAIAGDNSWPSYRSPEQAEGRPVDGRADLFSLGSILYAASTGRPPFEAESTEAILRRILTGEPTPVRRLNPEISSELAALIERLLAKQPVKRYQTAAEVAEILARQRAESPKPAPSTKRRQKMVLICLAFALAVSLVVFKRSGWTHLTRNPATRPSHPKVVPAPLPVVDRTIPLDAAKETDLLAQANDALQKKDNLRAVALYTEMLRRDPKRADTHFGRGVALGRLGRLSQAIDDLSTSIRIEPNFAGAYLIRGWARMASGDHSGAASDFGDAIRLDPTQPDAYFQRGLVLGRKLEKFAQAIDDLSKAIHIDPKAPHLYVQRGWARKKLEDNSGAILDFDDAIRLDPNDPLTYRERAEAFASLGNWPRAIEDMNTAIRLDPGQAGALEFRALCRLNHQELDAALADYDEIIRLDPKRARIYRQRAELLNRLGQSARAKADRREAERLEASPAK